MIRTRKNIPSRLDPAVFQRVGRAAPQECLVSLPPRYGVTSARAIVGFGTTEMRHEDQRLDWPPLSSTEPRSNLLENPRVIPRRGRYRQSEGWSDAESDQFGRENASDASEDPSLPFFWLFLFALLHRSKRRGKGERAFDEKLLFDHIKVPTTWHDVACF